MSQVLHIFIAPTRGVPMQPLVSVEAVENAGLVGDRHARANRDPTRQVTLIEAENIEHFIVQTGHPLAMSDPRRNIVTAGIRLNELCGRRFEIVRVLRNRGGLRGRIVCGGVLSVGDAILVQPISLRDQSAFAFG